MNDTIKQLDKYEFFNEKNSIYIIFKTMEEIQNLK